MSAVEHRISSQHIALLLTLPESTVYPRSVYLIFDIQELIEIPTIHSSVLVLKQ